MKRIFTLLFAAMLAGQAWAEYFYFEGLEYTVTDEVQQFASVSIIGGNPVVGTLKIPMMAYNENTDKYYIVTSIKNGAFAGCEGITSIEFSELIESIGDQAFYACKGLTSLTIPENIKSIGGSAFYYCTNLTSVTIPNTVTSIGSSAFGKCEKLDTVRYNTDAVGTLFKNNKSLKTVIIGNSVTNIAEQAFYGCSSLDSIIIPKSVKSIGKNAFGDYENYALKSITLESDADLSNASLYLLNNGVMYQVFNKDSVSVIKNSCSGNVIIPEKVISGSTFSKVSIGKNAFYNCSNLTSVVLKEGLKSIGEYAFYGCSKLSSINIPNSVTDIDKYAFCDCSGLESVTIGNGVTRIGWCAFNGCAKLASITIPDAVKKIEGNAFGSCSSLKSVTIGNSVDSILNWAFSSCTSLTTLKISKSVKSIGDDAFRGCTSLEKVDIPNGVEHIGNSAFRDCSNLKLITVANSVKTIDKWAFESVYVVVYPGSATGKPWDANYVYSAIDENGFLYDDVEKTKLAKYIGDNQDISIPEGVKIINDHAFSYSQLKSVTFPNSVESIGVYAFYNCTGLTSLVIPNGVTNIGAGAFYECSGITSLTISGPVKTIDEGAFEGCDNIKELICNSNGIGQQFKKDTVLETLIIGDSVTIIPDEAFENCSGLTSVTLGKSLTTIGAYAFYYCDKLTSITIPSSVKEIGIWAFAGCDNIKTLTCNTNAVGSHFSGKSSIETVVIGDSVTSIPDNAFYGCRGLKTVTIPNSVESIGEYAFNNCGLKSINIPSSVTSIGKLAFRGGPPYVYYLGGKAEEGSPWGANRVYKALDENGFLYYDTEKTQLAGYNGNKHDIIIPNSVKTISAEAFSGDTVITSVVIGDSVTAIEKYAFKDCSALTSVTIPSSVKSIDEKAFEGCSAIKQLTYNTDAVGIQFYENPLLETVVIGDSVTKIRNGTFYKCTGLKSVTIGKSVKNIGGSAFRECSSLTSITLPDSVESIGDYYTFLGCEALTTINIPNTVTSIGVSAFTGCSSLTSISIPEGVTTIERSAFTGCTSLKSLTLPHSLKEIVADAFSGCRIETLMFSTDAFGYRFLEDSVLKTVIIGDSTTIDGCSFQRCKNLETVIVPSSINYSIYTLFSGCNNIQYNEYGNALYLGNDENPYLVLVKAKSRDISSVEISENCRVIDNYAFSGCSSLTSITIPDSVTLIGDEAFYECSSLGAVTIPEKVTYIGYRAFSDCGNLTMMIIPKSVVRIGQYAFHNNSNLTLYCKAESKPEMWNNTWNSSNRPVVWGASQNLRIFKVDVAASDSVYGTVEGGGYTVSDSTMTIAAKPVKGYHFTSWSDGNTDNPRTLAVTSDTLLTALFEAHTIVTDSAVAPTVTTDGLTEGSHCRVCGKIIVAQELITALGEVAYYKYKIIGSSSVEITGYTGQRANISIPSEIVDDGTTYTVTDIAREAFSKNGNLTSVTIPSSVTYIGDNAFEGCNSLSSVIIPNSVTHIGDGAFSGCAGLESVTLPDAITYIPSAVFGGCTSLESIEIPSSVEFIGNSAFSGSGLTTISIPYSVTEIGSFAFQDCSELSTIIIPGSVEKIGNWTFKGCQNLTIYCCANSIPEGWETYWNSDNRPYDLGNCGAEPRWTVTVSANNSAFGRVTGGGSIINGSTTSISATPASGYEFVKWSNGLTNATETITVTSDTTLVAEFAKETLKPADSTSFSFNILSETAHTVEVSRYYGTGKAAAIPAKTVIDGVEYTVTSIGEDAFIYCRELTSVSIPNSVTNIEGFAFYGCTGLKSLTVPNSVTSIGWQAFDNVKNVIYTGNATGSPWYALAINGVVDGDFIYSDAERTNLVAYIGTNENVTIPNTVVSIGESAFEDSKIKTLTIPNTVTSISPNMCSDCDNLTSITIPNSVTNIGYRAFYCCSNLKSVTIPNSVEEIDDYAFYGCHSLTSVNLPNSVTDIGEESFAWCNNLMKINVDDGNNYYVSVDGVLFNKDKTIIVCYPAGRTGTYTIPNSVTTIGDAAFEFTKLSSVTIPSTVVDIEEDAFNGSDSLTYMNIPNSVTNIGVRAFYSCSNLASLTIPNSVASIDWYAFSYCSKLKSVACLATVPPVLDEDDPFISTDTVYVLSDYVAAYKAADVWKKKTILPITVKSNDATSGIVYGGDNVLLYAEPKAGYHFVSWSDNSVENPRKTTESEVSLTARFEAHIAVVDNAVAATCTTTGLTEGSHCSVCGEIIVAQTETPMIEHTAVVDSAVAATCTESGMTEGSHCSACGVVIVKQKKVSPLGHKFVDYIYNNDATTAADGTETAVCEHGCGETDTRTAVGTKLTNTPVTETAANAVNIYAHGNTIVVENATDEICVYDAMGRLVCRDAARHVSTVAESGVRAEIHVNTAGLYIVKVGNIAKRVMVN